LKDKITFEEFNKWRAFDKVEPGYPLREDYHAAIIAWTMATVMSSKKSRRLKIGDFLLKFGRIIKPRSPDELKNKLRHWKTGYDAYRKKQKRKKRTIFKRKKKKPEKK
jgi:hypothetical protein